MRAIVIENGRVFLREDYPEPPSQRDEVLIKVQVAGICDTDVQIAAGYMGFAGVLGHEFVGVVAEGPAPLIGKRVVGEINCPCGVCETCAAGRSLHCPHRTVLGLAGRDGCFATYTLLPSSNLHVVPDGVRDDAAVFVEPLAAALNVLEREPLPPSARVLVVGDGKLGLLVAAVLSLTCDDVNVAGHHSERAAVLARMARHLPFYAPSQTPLAHYDVVVDATGDPEGLTFALTRVRPQGRIILKTTVAAAYRINLAPVVVNEIVVTGNRCGPFRPALRLLAEGRVDPSPLIAGVHDAAAVPSLLTAGAPGLKHLIRFD